MAIAQALSSFRKRYSQGNNEATRNPWFLALLGLIAVFLMVNLVFVVFAVTSNPGLVSDDYYEQGREYEKNVVTRITARDNLNWETKFELPEQIYSNTPDVFRFSAVDARGVSIMDADVKFVLYRPSDAGADFEQTVNQLAPGLYQSELTLPLPGIWDLHIKVRHGEDVYHHSHRINVLTP